ncbi:sodium-dependent transporter [Nocardioides insulae]|uniref:sodium-dependent transporter n=1 Tax=Nocardioides insulae TaxID=394734 RepID=UPI000418364F|nr:sodium-dependent transporter [Nocardioides insulae]
MSHIDASETQGSRGAFSSRRVFIFAAIGSAVGLGNIWRFPYVAYDNGGGAFMIPYLVALLTAGIPFLFLDYAMGHRTRGSAPLAFARMRKWTEGLGWWQVAICFVIACYYAAILAWSLRYMIFSVTEAWGDDPNTFFFGDFLKAGDPGVSLDPVWGVLLPMALVWIALIAVLALGVQKGIGATAAFFIPLLVVAFVLLVVQALFLDGASDGLDALFTPDWGALAEPGVWAAAYGQIFFSLSIGFGIMITYSSYVGRGTDMPGSGLVVGFANSSFELLAGIGVFAALGFMAQAAGTEVTEVASSGIGLAFVAFPTIISEAPLGGLLGVLFFGSLVIAGFTSLVSIVEVVISAVRDKFALSRITATLAVSVPIAVVSLVLFGTASGIHVLDIVDNFINNFGILVVAVVSMVVVGWVLRALPLLSGDLNQHTSVHVGLWWTLLIGLVAPVALTAVLIRSMIDTIQTPYGGDGYYPAWMLDVFGWGVAAGVILIGFLAALVPWRPGTSLALPPLESAPTPGGGGAHAAEEVE